MGAREAREEIDMLRATFAGAIGAVLAIAIAFLVVAVVSAAGGVPVMFEPEREVYGWEGAQYGMILFIFIGVVTVWPFPAIALTGAAVGVIVRQALRRRRISTHSPNSDRQGGRG
jgi:hypothetical protein